MKNLQSMISLYIITLRIYNVNLLDDPLVPKNIPQGLQLRTKTGNLGFQSLILGLQGLDLPIKLLGRGKVDRKEIVLVQGVEILHLVPIDEDLALV